MDHQKSQQTDVDASAFRTVTSQIVYCGKSL